MLSQFGLTRHLSPTPLLHLPSPPLLVLRSGGGTIPRPWRQFRGGPLSCPEVPIQAIQNHTLKPGPIGQSRSTGSGLRYDIPEWYILLRTAPERDISLQTLLVPWCRRLGSVSLSLPQRGLGTSLLQATSQSLWTSYCGGGGFAGGEICVSHGILLEGWWKMDQLSWQKKGEENYGSIASVLVSVTGLITSSLQKCGTHLMQGV